MKSMHVMSDEFTDLYTYFFNDTEIRSCSVVRAVEEPVGDEQVKPGRFLVPWQVVGPKDGRSRISHPICSSAM